MISNSAQRASLVPNQPRISLYISKINYTHDLVMQSGVAGIHLLRVDQWSLIWHLGLQSGRDVDKLSTIATHVQTTGAPIIDDVHVAYDCRVSNIMDAGAATFFLLDVVDAHRGTPGDVMTSTYFREHMPAEKKVIYEARLIEAMQYLEPMSADVDASKRWNGATTAP
jgi:flavin reductase (DIM6/NTAB) family NADH-FMN oxidoreductase RutF